MIFDSKMEQRNGNMTRHIGSGWTISTSQSQLEMSLGDWDPAPPKNDGSVESETATFARALALRNGMRDI